MSKLQAIRGMHDILPDQSWLWRHIEQSLQGLFDTFGYQEIRTPIVEQSQLFKRAIGEVTDIVEKEMYTFEDRNGDSLSLRPEATASCVRAGISHGLFHNAQPRLWYSGPMFRYERPQKGRYRQFHQIGAEAFGLAGPDIDAELILICGRIWSRLGLTDITLELNSLGTPESRAEYRDLLVNYFSDHYGQLDEDSRRRLGQNPLRILDSKNPAMQALLTDAGLGVDIVGVRLQDMHPPLEVVPAFRDVASAQEDKETAINVAWRYRDETVNLARGEAARQGEIARSDSGSGARRSPLALSRPRPPRRRGSRAARSRRCAGQAQPTCWVAA